MKITKEEFKQKVDTLYNGDIEVIGHFKGISKPILIKDKYGLLEYSQARQVLSNKPSIYKALNKTVYFMNMLKEKQPLIYSKIKPLSEYLTMKDNIIFETIYGEVSISPDALLSGHEPTIRSAIDRKKYFKNMLIYLYDGKYDFEVTTSDRHGGRSNLICPIHGKISIDNDYLFSGCGCPKCNNHNTNPSNLFYLIELTNNTETFYKFGITYELNGIPKKYKDYKLLGYSINEIKLIKFEDPLKCREFENKLKNIIKPYIFIPNVWKNKTTTECFKIDLIDAFLNSYINNDIV